MGVKIIRLAIDTGRMDLAAHALVLAAIQLGVASFALRVMPVPTPGSGLLTKEGERQNQISNSEKQNNK